RHIKTTILIITKRGAGDLKSYFLVNSYGATRRPLEMRNRYDLPAPDNIGHECNRFKGLICWIYYVKDIQANITHLCRTQHTLRRTHIRIH
ncbi:hypothetical protein M5D96_007737, partial [Drosophila gunungcola]